MQTNREETRTKLSNGTMQTNRDAKTKPGNKSVKTWMGGAVFVGKHARLGMVHGGEDWGRLGEGLT